MLNKKISFSAQARAEIAGLDNLDKKRAFVRDCFLTGGTLSHPSRSYHMEFVLDTKQARKLISILQNFGLNPKKTTRRALELIYFKEANEIADILNIIKAHKTLLLFENIRVEKDLRNQLNRKINFETANLNKTVYAAVNQIEAIEIIAETKGLATLPPTLKEVAELRLQYETASLEEIGAMLTPPIGKSGVNHRLRKICELAKEIKKGKGDDVD